MRVLVCGSRHFGEEDYGKAVRQMEGVLNCYAISEIIHGNARGADRLSGDYAHTKSIKLTVFPANWDKYGKGAGPIRNLQMLKEGKPDLVVAFMAKDSRGTKNMVDQATKAGVEVKVINI